MGLTSGQARHFYDWFGRAQDLQAFYEDPAAGDLLARGRFGDARAVFELGCGTGRLAARLLGHQLPADARYLGADISGTMTSLSRARLRRFGRRAAIIRAEGTWPLPLAAGAFDLFLAVYVLDLLAPREAAALVAEARRLLRPGGLLGVVSLTHGTTTPARLVSWAWTAAWSRAPGLTGGCRPITVLPLLDGWCIEHRALVSAWTLTSEVVVASSRCAPSESQPGQDKRLGPTPQPGYSRPHRHSETDTSHPLVDRADLGGSCRDQTVRPLGLGRRPSGAACDAGGTRTPERGPGRVTG